MKFLTFLRRAFTQNIPIKIAALFLAAVAVVLMNAVA